MSRVLRKFPRRSAEYVSVYDKYLDGRVHELVRGVDFHTTRASAGTTLKRRARRLGGFARTQSDGKTETIVVQFMKDPG